MTMIAEFPVNLECLLVKNVDFGSHRVYFGEVVAVHADADVVVDGKVDPAKLQPRAYFSPASCYLGVNGTPLGSYGFSARG